MIIASKRTANDVTTVAWTKCRRRNKNRPRQTQPQRYKITARWFSNSFFFFPGVQTLFLAQRNGFIFFFSIVVAMKKKWYRKEFFSSWLQWEILMHLPIASTLFFFSFKFHIVSEKNSEFSTTTTKKMSLSFNFGTPVIRKGYKERGGGYGARRKMNAQVGGACTTTKRRLYIKCVLKVKKKKKLYYYNRQQKKIK